MQKLNLLQRVNLLTQKADVTKITEENIMNIMRHLNQSFDDIINMPLYTYNKFIQYLHEQSKTKTLSGAKIGLGSRKKT